LIAFGIAAGVVHARLAPLHGAFGEEAPSTVDPIEAKAPPELRGRFIDVERAFALSAEPDVEFVDARAEGESAAGRVARAHALSPEAFANGRVPDFATSMPRSSRYVIYCGGDDCDAAILTALRLRAFGFENLFVMKGGYAGWAKAGHPIER
jgi:rhodanese-related sulfurtransferase